MKTDWKKYAITFVITSAIFITALYISTLLNNERADKIRDIQDSISINILSAETQFNLLKEAACEDLFSSALGQELGSLSDRLSYMESMGRSNESEVKVLKRYYTLLEIKDYLLIKSAGKCPKRPNAILYFYQSDCDDCKKQSEVLTYLRLHNLDDLRVYSFDYELDVSALRTLANINKVKGPFPVLVIKDKAYNGYMTIEDIEKILPSLSATSTSATSTKK